MRPHRLATGLALLLSLLLAAPAVAADRRVDVVSFDFRPAQLRIAVGDSVTWSFLDPTHNSVSLGGQPDSWRSASGGRTNAAGSRFTKTFRRPGRYQYVCIPHRSFMKGVVQVGSDSVRKTVSRFRTRTKGRRARVSLRLNEPAKVTFRVTGATRRTVRRGRLAKGGHSFTLRNLAAGKHRGTLTVTDDFDKRSKRRTAFTIR